jgi:hypothetical protein
MADEQKVLFHIDRDLYWEFKELAATRRQSVKALLDHVLRMAVRDDSGLWDKVQPKVPKKSTAVKKPKEKP